MFFFPVQKKRKCWLHQITKLVLAGKLPLTFFPLAPYKVKRNRQGHFLLSPFLLSLSGSFFLHLPKIRAEKKRKILRCFRKSEVIQKGVSLASFLLLSPPFTASFLSSPVWSSFKSPCFLSLVLVSNKQFLQKSNTPTPILFPEWTIVNWAVLVGVG